MLQTYLNLKELRFIVALSTL